MHLFTSGVVLFAAYAAASPQYHQPYGRRQGPVSNDTTSSVSSTLSSTDVETSTLTPVLSSSSTSSAAAAASTSAQAIAVPGGTYTAVGCYIDTGNTGYPLVGAVKVSTQSTTQQCLSTCAEPAVGGPFAYSGVEGTECFCSNTFNQNAAASPGACGGGAKRDVLGKRQAGGAISIYQFTPSSSTSVAMSSTSFSTASSSQTATTTEQSSSVSSSVESSTSSTTSETSTTTSATLSSTSSSPVSTTSSATAPPVPTPTGPYVIVASGDTLASLAQRYGISLAALEALNPQIVDPNSIFPGEYINLPSTNPANVNPQPTNPATPPPPPPFSAPFTAFYTVRSGDTLGSIASAFGFDLSVLIAANPQITNPNFIVPGQIINIPAIRVYTYNVAAGNTLYSIAQAFGISLSALEAANPQIPNFNVISPGQVINIPR